MAQRPADEFSDPSAEDDGGAPAPRSRAAIPASIPTPPRRRTGRGPGRGALVATGGITALVLVTAGVLHAQARDERTPEAAVLEYVQLIEDGDIEAASALVPVPGAAEPDPAGAGPVAPSSPGSPTVDGGRPITVEIPVTAVERVSNPGLLTDASYGDNPGITDVSVEALGERELPTVGDHVEVAVTYAVQERPARTVLRVERLPDSFPGLPAWRVIDSLTVPLVVTTPDAGLGTVHVAGVPVAASGSGDLPAIGMLLYPGVYVASFDGGAYLEAVDVERRVAAPGSGVDPATARTLATLDVVPSQAARDLLEREVAAHLDGCGAATLDLETCPEPYRSSPASGDPSAFTAVVASVGFGVVADRDSEPVVPLIFATIDGSLTFSTADGTAEEPFALTVHLRLDDAGPTAEVLAVQQGS